MACLKFNSVKQKKEIISKNWRKLKVMNVYVMEKE